LGIYDYVMQFGISAETTLGGIAATDVT
jgi:hypothetical protein